MLLATFTDETYKNVSVNLTIREVRLIEFIR